MVEKARGKQLGGGSWPHGGCRQEAECDRCCSLSVLTFLAVLDSLPRMAPPTVSMSLFTSIS